MEKNASLGVGLNSFVYFVCFLFSLEMILSSFYEWYLLLLLEESIMELSFQTIAGDGDMTVVICLHISQDAPSVGNFYCVLGLLEAGRFVSRKNSLLAYAHKQGVLRMSS